MKTKDVIAKVKAHKGDICVTMLMRNDVRHVKVVKFDLLDQIKNVADYEIECSVNEHGVLFIDDCTTEPKE